LKCTPLGEESTKGIVVINIQPYFENTDLPKEEGIQAFSQMGIQVSCGWPFSIANNFISYMLPYKLLI